MAWNDVMVPMLRLLIDDFDASDYKYDDDRLEQQILLAAQLMQGGEIIFPNTYTISVAAIEISPDPIEEADDVFINLVTLKAACLLERAETRIAINEGIDISDDKSKLSLSGKGKAKLDMLKTVGYCEEYKKAKLEYQLGSMNPGIAVLSPFRLFTGFDDEENDLF